MADVRLIDANALTRWLESVLSNANPLDRKARAAFSEVLARVKTMLDIDAVPVVHGRWIEEENGVIVCSECGEEHCWDEYRATYCEDCGAKMDEPSP